MGCYIPGTEQEQLEMLKSIGFDSFDGLFSHIPQQVRLEGGLNLPEGLSELEVIRKMADACRENTVFRHIFREPGLQPLHTRHRRQRYRQGRICHRLHALSG